MADWEMIIKSSASLCRWPNELFSSGPSVSVSARGRPRRRGQWGRSSLERTGECCTNVSDQKRSGVNFFVFFFPLLPNRSRLHLEWMLGVPRGRSLMTLAALWPLIQHRHQDKMSSPAPQRFKQTWRINPRQLSTWEVFVPENDQKAQPSPRECCKVLFWSH